MLQSSWSLTTRSTRRKSLTDALGRIKHVVAFFGSMKLSQVTTATIKAYIKHRRSEERIVSRERTILNADGTVTVVPEVRRKPSNAQINRETTMLGRMFSLARQDDKIINRPHIPKLKEPAQPRKGFFEYGDFVKVRDHLDPALRNIAEFEYVTGWRIDTEVLPLCGARLTSRPVRFASMTRAPRRTRKPGCFPLPRIFDAPLRPSGS